MTTPAKNTVCLWYDGSAERVDRRVYRDGHSLPWAQRWTGDQAQLGILVSGRNRRPGRNGSLLERHRRQRRRRE